MKMPPAGCRGRRGRGPRRSARGRGARGDPRVGAGRREGPRRLKTDRITAAGGTAMRKLVTLLAGAMVGAWTSSGFPQAGGANFPARPVRMVVAFTPGGGTDIIARIVAQKLTERWGQPVVVENRAGAGGNIGTDMVARGAPDGYTILMAFSSHASNPALYGKLPFDINKDFSSITMVGTRPIGA